MAILKDSEGRLPAECFPPGVYLAEELEARGINHDTFASLLGITHDDMNRLITGDLVLRISIAEKISHILGISIDVWLNLDRMWRRWKKAKGL